MKSFIKLDSTESTNGVVNIHFSTSDNLNKYFNKKIFIYECKYCEHIPISILNIPFVTNILPIIWLTNSVLEIDELDKTFYESISEFKKGYIRMYPQLAFKGSIITKEIVSNTYQVEKNLVLFSGGIDAICTVLRHINEKLSLLTLWGSADFPIDDYKGWEIHWNDINYNIKQLNLSCDYIKTNFCDFIPIWGKNLRGLVKPAHAEWWHDFQHGIGILGHAAPYAYIHKIGTVYIASSYDASRKPYTCASDPTIDNYVKFGNTKVVHDGYEWNRQDKIRFIAEKIKERDLKFKIHVCLRQYQLENCCHCEKCYRTILGLIAEGLSPDQYGFNIKSLDIKNMFSDLKYNIFINDDKKIVYKKIQERIIENQKNIPNKNIVKWFTDTDFDKINNNLPKYYKRCKNFVVINTRKFIGRLLRSLKIIK
ncbi:hypothetical protein [Phocaeicola plebeius]|uniref:hypothetical protein n=1 Tax=Phocaeicola plebeius TaxID=310297 RepID=UPI0026EF9428|nr:hypothetical protein [Phocaeicola plebeius]